MALMGFASPSGGIGGTGIRRGGIGGTGVSALGVIQKFGSIFVNGTEYLLLPATRYWRDGHPVQERRLRRGDAIFITGTQTSTRSVALDVRVQHALIGLVQAVHARGLRLRILGQTVYVGRDTLTRFTRSHHGQSLRAGMDVAVSALARAPGQWQATRVALAHTHPSAPQTFLMRGSLRMVGRHALALGNRLFVFAGRRPISAQVGDYVVARGYYRSGHAVVTRVRPSAGLDNAVGPEILVTGYLRLVRGHLRYEGRTLRQGADLSIVAGRHPAFFIIRRDAAGHLTIVHVTPHVDIMHYGLDAPRIPIIDPDHPGSAHKGRGTHPSGPPPITIPIINHPPMAPAPTFSMPPVMRPSLSR